MTEAEGASDALIVERVGDKLRAARTSVGLDLADVATKTRIPQRHLEAIESGDYSALPSITYAVGFVKAYARTVGADEVELAKCLRTELGQDGESRYAQPDDGIADPARVPPRWLAWGAAIVVVLIAAGYGVWRSGALESRPSVIATEAPEPANSITIATPQPKPVAGPVVLTAQDDVWFRIYDKSDKVLFEGVKKKGEAYQVPADADTPMIRTGRADQIAVTVGGQAVPALGPAEATVKDVVLTGPALVARPAPAAAPQTATTATPSTGAAARP